MHEIEISPAWLCTNDSTGRSKSARPPLLSLVQKGLDEDVHTRSDTGSSSNSSSSSIACSLCPLQTNYTAVPLSVSPSPVSWPMMLRGFHSSAATGVTLWHMWVSLNYAFLEGWVSSRKGICIKTRGMVAPPCLPLHICCSYVCRQLSFVSRPSLMYFKCISWYCY